MTATDPDDTALIYTLAGTDAGLFTVDREDGQIRVGSGTALDFEGDTTAYALTVQASDGKDDAGETETSPAIDASRRGHRHRDRRRRAARRSGRAAAEPRGGRA